METNTPQTTNLLQIKAFSTNAKIGGVTYYCSHSRMFSILRLPAAMKYLYPDLKKQKLRFEILCFPTKQQLLEYLETTEDVPLMLNLFAREIDKP